MKKLALALALLLLAPAGANALQTEEVAALVAMPLAVAAVSELAGVPTNDLVDVVVAMNRARVPPVQFVEVVRYVPVALVEEPRPFVQYVETEVDRGIYGDDLAYGIADRIETYDVDDIDIINPPTLMVLERQAWVPPVVVTRLGLRPVGVTSYGAVRYVPTTYAVSSYRATRYEPLELIAMPLAVAAVSDLFDVPPRDFFPLVAALNDAYVPPAQFVEIVRYSPAVFVDPVYEPRFLPFVRTSIDDGYTRDRLAFAIADRYRDWGLDTIDIVEPDIVYVDRGIALPSVVSTRVLEASRHPHGGAPGQLKKDLGLQTGAEVVHGQHPSSRIIDVVDSGRARTVTVDSGRRGRVVERDVDRPRTLRRDTDRPRTIARDSDHRSSRRVVRDDDRRTPRVTRERKASRRPTVRQEDRRTRPAVRERKSSKRTKQVREVQRSPRVERQVARGGGGRGSAQLAPTSRHAGGGGAAKTQGKGKGGGKGKH